jgi:DNA repair protein NreA
MTALAKADANVDSGNTSNWLTDLVNQVSHATFSDQISTRMRQSSQCVLCKGARNLCGKTSCSIMLKLNMFLRSAPLLSSEDIDGASPPSVFIGRVGYPNIYVGPLVPPVHENTSMFDLPERWFGKSIDEIVGFRSLLVRGKYRVNALDFASAGKIMEQTRELALADDSVAMQLNLTKKPRGSIYMDDSAEPFGPSAPIRDLNVGNTRFNQHVEKAYYDTDLKATQAVRDLYNRGVLVSKIQKAFSVGAFGVEKKRRLVPTRWSITAVDDIISKSLMMKVKTFPEISEYRVYESIYMDNVFEILMLPQAWSYESMEAWYPGTTWNPNGDSIVIYSDAEGNNGRTTYAAIGGCYYSARLATCEQLIRERRQATVIVLREARPGYIMPIGVWQVRENVRNAMRQKPAKFNTLEATLRHVNDKFQIPMQQWIIQGKLIRKALFQKRLSDFFQPNPATCT